MTGSADHQLVLVKDYEDTIVYAQIHLTTHRKFFSRLVAGIKYACGYKSRYGAFDEIIITKDNYGALKNAVEFLDGKLKTNCNE